MAILNFNGLFDRSLLTVSNLGLLFDSKPLSAIKSQSNVVKSQSQVLVSSQMLSSLGQMQSSLGQMQSYRKQSNAVKCSQMLTRVDNIAVIDRIISVLFVLDLENNGFDSLRDSSLGYFFVSNAVKCCQMLSNAIKYTQLQSNPGTVTYLECS